MGALLTVALLTISSPGAIHKHVLFEEKCARMWGSRQVQRAAVHSQGFL